MSHTHTGGGRMNTSSPSYRIHRTLYTICTVRRPPRPRPRPDRISVYVPSQSRRNRARNPRSRSSTKHPDFDDHRHRMHTGTFIGGRRNADPLWERERGSGVRSGTCSKGKKHRVLRIGIRCVPGGERKNGAERAGQDWWYEEQHEKKNSLTGQRT